MIGGEVDHNAAADTEKTKGAGRLLGWAIR